MSKAALLSFCEDARKKIIYHEEDGRTYVETRQDAAPIIAAAKILAEVPPDPKDGWRFLGMIPATTMNQAMIEGWFHDPKAWRRWFNDRDNRAFNGGRERVG